MTSLHSIRPSADEHAAYYGTYIGAVPDGDILATLSQQLESTPALLRGLSDQQGMFAYAEGKWNLKEVVGHIIDCERIFAYRALRIARGDQTPLPSFAENDFAKFGGYASRTLSDITDEFQHLRVSTLDLLSHLDESAWVRRGIASNNPVSVRAMAWIIAGHERHHMNIIRERYL